MPPTFGKPAKDRPQQGGSFEMYIKTFEDGKSRIAVLQDDPETWTEVREHYDPKLKITFPCAKHEGFDECLGCDYPVEHPEWEDLKTHFPDLDWRDAMDERKKQDWGWNVRAFSEKRIFPALDPKGYVSIYKVGKGLVEDFQTQYEVLGSIMANEWTISRSGTGFGTKYGLTAMPGDVRKPQYPVPTLEQIQEALGRKYSYALEKYGKEPADSAPPAEQSQPDPAPVPTTGPAAESAVDPANPTSPPAAENKEPAFIPREASTGEIKDWLASLDPPVEFPAKAPRGTLVTLAEKTMTERDIPPF